MSDLCQVVHAWPERGRDWPGDDAEEDPKDYDAIVVGAGIGGIYATLKLLKVT